MRNKNLRVLLIMDYWRGAEEKWGMSNENYHFMGSLSSIPWVTVDRICPDSGVVNRDGREEIATDTCNIDYIRAWHDNRKPDVIVCMETNGVKAEDICRLRRQIETPVVEIWFDSSPSRIEKIHDEYSNIDLHILLDGVETTLPDRFMWIPTPMDPTITFNDFRERPIPVSYMGRVLDCDGKRWERIQALRAAEIPVYHRGGQGEDIIPVMEYYDIFRSSKISLNFAAPGKLKGRVQEVTMCGALLMEPEVGAGKYLFEPGKEIVTFGSSLDLIDKVRYYLAHDEERENIARAGYDRVVRDYNANALWSQVFERVLGNNCA